MIYSHFTAEGEVTFKSILYVPKASPFDLFSNYNKKIDAIKLYVRRVFITDNFEEMMPKYLSFIRGVVDSDDLPLNVSRETLQQSKLLKVIKKKLVRKALDMLKKISAEDYVTFWKEYGTNIKLGVIEDSANRTRLAKLLRFTTSLSGDKQISLADYIERMKPKQEHIYFIAAMTTDEAQKSPFVERVLKKGYEVLYLTDPVDQYCMQSLPEYEGKKFQNVAKDGLELEKPDAKNEEIKKQLEQTYEPLLAWLKDKLSDRVSDAKISDRLVQTPMALVALQWGYDGNMERIARAQAYQKSGGDATTSYYLNQKKTLEINPRHPLIKDLLRRVEDSKDDQTAIDLARVMLEAATLRSGYDLKDSAGFADRIETMLRRAMGVSLDEKVEEEPGDDESDVKLNTDEDENVIDDDDTDTKSTKAKQSTKVYLLENRSFFYYSIVFIYLFRIRMTNMMIFRRLFLNNQNFQHSVKYIS
jgi:heat shock protein beta